MPARNRAQGPDGRNKVEGVLAKGNADSVIFVALGGEPLKRRVADVRSRKGDTHVKTLRP